MTGHKHGLRLCYVISGKKMWEGLERIFSIPCSDIWNLWTSHAILCFLSPALTQIINLVRSFLLMRSSMLSCFLRESHFSVWVALLYKVFSFQADKWVQRAVQDSCARQLCNNILFQEFHKLLFQQLKKEKRYLEWKRFSFKYKQHCF